MARWELIDTAQVPNGGELKFYQRGDEFSIRVRTVGELMNSHTHGSEDELAELTCSEAADGCILVGGLGMGFTLAAALKCLSPKGRVDVCELVPKVVEWNRGPLGDAAGRPLNDPRVTVLEQDVADVLRGAKEHYDGIAMDVDNGPEGMVRIANDWLYSIEGLAQTYEALRPGGVFTLWSAGYERAFTGRLRKLGFGVTEHRVRAHGKKGARHVIWHAVRPKD
jgi:spermidine synthase